MPGNTPQRTTSHLLWNILKSLIQSGPKTWILITERVQSKTFTELKQISQALETNAHPLCSSSVCALMRYRLKKSYHGLVAATGQIQLQFRSPLSASLTWWGDVIRSQQIDREQYKMPALAQRIHLRRINTLRSAIRSQTMQSEH